MEIVTSGCSLPLDLVIANTCIVGSIGGSIGLSLLVGVAAFLFFGLLRFGGNQVSNLVKSPQQRQADTQIDQIGRALRCLIAMAAADGRLDDFEVLVIRRVGAEHFGIDFDDEMIRDMYQKMGTSIDVEAEIQGNFGGNSLRDPEAISALFHGMIYVAACDGEISGSERELLKRIAQLLGLDQARIDQMILDSEREALEFSQAAAHTG